MEISLCRNINEDMKNKFIDIIKNSFEQEDQSKSRYVRDQLKALSKSKMECYLCFSKWK